VLNDTNMSNLENGSRRYSIWIKVDDALPWFELSESYRTKNEAQTGAKQKIGATKVKVVNMSTLEHEGERQLPLIRIKATH
jgi:hypothetical protein